MFEENLNYDDLVQGKIQELREIQDQKIRQLEQNLQQQQTENILNQSKYAQLEEDFQYNLQVIEQRDHDIEELVSKMQEISQIIQEKDEEIEQLQNNIQIHENFKHNIETKQKEKTQILYQKIDDLKQEIKFFKSNQAELQQKNLQQEQQFQNEKNMMNNQIQNLTNEIEAKLKTQEQNLIDSFQKEREGFEKVIFQLKNEKQFREGDTEKQLQRLLDENKNILQDLNQEREKNLNLQKMTADQMNELRQQIQNITNEKNVYEKELKNLKSSGNQWEIVMKEKIEAMSSEKEKIQEEYTKYKLKHKQKLKEFKETAEKHLEDILKENHEKTKKLEFENHELTIKNTQMELIIQNQKEKIQERDMSFRNQIDELENKCMVLQNNIAQDKKQWRNDMEIKDFQIRQTQDEKEIVQKKIEEYKKNLEQITKNIEELEKENRLLIEEVIKYRRDGIHNSPHRFEANLEQKIHKSQKMKQQSQNVSKTAQKPQKNFLLDDLGIKEDQQEMVESYDKLFSDDQGPVSPIQSMFPPESIFQMGKQSNKMSQAQTMNQQNQQKMYIKLKEYEEEIKNYKILIDNMTKEMETVKNRIVLGQQEIQFYKEENLGLRGRLNQLQQDLMEQRQQQSINFQQKTFQTQEIQHDSKKLLNEIEKYKKRIEDFNKERETLLQISNELRSQIRDLQDQLKEPDQDQLQSLQAQNDQAYERIQELEHQLSEYKKKIEKANIIIKEKNDMIEKLRQDQIDYMTVGGGYSLTKFKINVLYIRNVQLAQITYNNNKKEKQTKQQNSVSPPQREGRFRQIPKYENFMDIDQNFELRGQQANLIPKGDGDRDNSQQYRQNSSKQTVSQKKILQKLKDYKPTPIIRNYNLKDPEVQARELEFLIDQE